MSEKRIVGNEVKNRMVFYIVMVLTLVLTLGFSNAVSAKTKVKTYKITYVLKGGTNNKKNTQLKIQNYIRLKERAILLRDGIRTKIIQSVLEK